jgi:hypothetical protein
MRVITKKILIPALVILIGAGAYATLRKPAAVIPVTPAFTIPVADKEEQLILKELSTLLHHTDTLTVMTITGHINAEDLADSSNTIQAEFCYSRQGNIAYYRIGQNEMISLSNAYINIAHDVKKIFLSGPKEVVNPVKMPTSEEVALLSKEGYKVSRIEKGNLTEISLVSNTHITCREYRVSFDSTGFIRQTYTRLTDPYTPTDKTRDKLMHLTIRSWELGKVRTELLSMDRYIKIVDGEPAPAASLKGYELIREH